MDEEPVAVGQTATPVVDPEIRAYVYSLVTALGGFTGEDADKYVLGDDALACLRDIKKWLKLYDEKTNRLDVSRCLGEANLVNGDLIPILSLWYEVGQNNKHMSRIALACLELLVPLTWPIERQKEMTRNHHRHTPYLQQAQVLYKRGLLTRNTKNMLRTIIRIGLPSMAISKSDRTTRDEGILKLVLYLLRNIIIISPSARLAAEGEEEETSRSATINAFQDQDVFALLLTMCSNIGDDFVFQDVIILEILFHLVRGVSVDKLFMDDTQRSAKQTDELRTLLRKESGVKREYAKNAPTRHGRFGTMIWVKRDDEKVSTVSGQDILKDGEAALLKMDQTKKWNKPRVGRRSPLESVNNDFSTPCHLNSSATKNLRMFVEEFLDSGFNPLFIHVRKAIEREADRVSPVNIRQFFYLVGWFLEAERLRRDRQKRQREQSNDVSKDIGPDSFDLVAGVLDQETFVFLNRAMQKSFDDKEWHELNAVMSCFTQILLTIQEMAVSPIEEDREIADNIQSRIFYEETTHDRIISIVRGYKDQGFGYLDACTELSHVFLRMLENYSKENLDMQVRSRRRANRKKKQAEVTPAANGDNRHSENDGEDQDSEEEELIEAAQVSRERKFDFNRLAAKFCNQKCVDTFVCFTAYYRELNPEQLRRAHRFFYRVAFKQELSVLLFRVDIINLFYNMIKGPGALDSKLPGTREWEELVRQIIKKLIKKLEQRPELITEMLFSKINATLFYLEYGYEKQTHSANRPPAELEIARGAARTTHEKLAIVIYALTSDDNMDLVYEVKTILESAMEQRKEWEARDQARLLESPESVVLPCPKIDIGFSNNDFRTAMFKNAKLRLLMTLLGFEREGTEDVLGARWVIPPSLSSKDLQDLHHSVQFHIENPDAELADPLNNIRRKPSEGESRATEHQATLNVDFGSESEGEDSIPDGPLFAPNLRTKSNALEELKKNRRKKVSKDEDKMPLDDQIIEERRRAREANADARLAKIKSDLYIHASDEESDEEADRDFFQREEEGRKAQDQRVREALFSSRLEQITGKKPKLQRGRKRASFGDDNEAGSDSESRKRQRRRASNSDDDLDLDSDDDLEMSGAMRSPSANEDDAAHNTPPTSTEDQNELDSDGDLSLAKFRTSRNDHPGVETSSKGLVATAVDSDEEDTEPVATTARRRMKAGFVVESDSE